MQTPSLQIDATKSAIELQQNNLRDAAAMLYGNCFAGLGISVLASSFLVFGFNDPSLEKFKINWWLAMLAIMFLRLLDRLWWQTRQSNTNYDGKNAIRRYIFGVWVTAFMWSLYSLSVFRHVDSIELSSILIVVSAMAGGGSTILNAHKITAIGYSTLLLGPLSLGLALFYDGYQQYVGLLGLGFCFVMIFTSRKASNFTAEAIRAKNVNAVLVNQMEEVVEQRTKKIYELSNLDPLTGLFNRTAFTKHLDQKIDSCKILDQPLALLFIDLDGFKGINDALGHEIGDRILSLTAARLEKFAPNENLLCRWGGDEFLLALENTSESSAREYAKALSLEISEPYVFENNRLSVGATFGIAVFPEHASSGAELIRLADTAMFFQKKQARSSIGVFSPNLSAGLHREQYLRDGLAEAISKNQLKAVFQPIVTSETGQVVAFEALLRWQFGDEIVSPDEFILVAEQYGLIRKIGAWVLNEACRVASTWHPNTDIAVCVNVSVIQLMDDDFIDIVDVALETNRLSGNALHIEITESVFASDKQVIYDRVRQLQKRGIHVSIDDFGTGYSSLSAMQDLAVDIVKIDKSFIDSIDSKGFAVISAVLNIAKSLRCRVVAEGIETEQQAKKLAQLGVHFQQGYYFAEPMEQDQILEFLNQPVASPKMLSLVR